MGPEILESMGVDRLDLEHRTKLQIELMKQMLGDNPSHQKQLVWAQKYSKIVSGLIDSHEHDEIRNLAFEENYIEAAKLLGDLLEE
ncbi:MAG: hypothetical protein AAB969_03855 [Patescibacteria group bacterium]